MEGFADWRIKISYANWAMWRSPGVRVAVRTLVGSTTQCLCTNQDKLVKLFSPSGRSRDGKNYRHNLAVRASPLAGQQ
jgi:hypothetical protein